MNIFRLYAQNGDCAGFWVQHRRWANACARIKSIDGHEWGALPADAEIRDDIDVEFESFDVRSGRRLDAELQPARDANYDQIAEPFWYRSRYARRTRTLQKTVRPN